MKSITLKLIVFSILVILSVSTRIKSTKKKEILTWKRNESLTLEKKVVQASDYSGYLVPKGFLALCDPELCIGDVKKTPNSNDIICPHSESFKCRRCLNRSTTECPKYCRNLGESGMSECFAVLTGDDGKSALEKIAKLFEVPIVNVKGLEPYKNPLSSEEKKVTSSAEVNKETVAKKEDKVVPPAEVNNEVKKEEIKNPLESVDKSSFIIFDSTGSMKSTQVTVNATTKEKKSLADFQNEIIKKLEINNLSKNYCYCSTKDNVCNEKSAATFKETKKDFIPVTYNEGQFKISKCIERFCNTDFNHITIITDGPSDETSVNAPKLCKEKIKNTKVKVILLTTKEKEQKSTQNIKKIGTKKDDNRFDFDNVTVEAKVLDA